VEPAAIQKAMIKHLAQTRPGGEEPHGGAVAGQYAGDNHRRQKIGLDQRLKNARLSDSKESKVNTCIENIYRI
jgi:hypothetical protein